MNDHKTADVFYTILRNDSPIDRNTVKEMLDNDVINSHRDFFYDAEFLYCEGQIAVTGSVRKSDLY